MRIGPCWTEAIQRRMIVPEQVAVAESPTLLSLDQSLQTKSRPCPLPVSEKPLRRLVVRPGWEHLGERHRGLRPCPVQVAVEAVDDLLHTLPALEHQLLAEGADFAQQDDFLWDAVD